ncbi:hypothetical protein J4422_04305 [Candidatus Pacearchaeota archaeon]|nr:hypothetical protein [Candidatus Pacearchaeota archaeon]
MVKRGKKGLSEIVSVVLILALTVTLVGIVWAVVNNLVEDNLSKSSCFETFGKISINNDYTCYNSSSNELQFSISVGDVNLDELLIGVSAAGTSASFRLTSGVTQVANLVAYPDRSTNVKLPGKNSGLTYLFNMGAAGLSGPAESIRIAPVIGNDQCEVSDAIEEIDNCLSLAP